jgi:hypothetical protein
VLGAREVLAKNRRDALKLASGAGSAKTRKLLEDAERDLSRRLRQAVKGPGDKSFTHEQLKATLTQVRAVLKDVKGGMKDVLVEQSRGVAEKAAGGVINYLEAADEAFRGAGTQPLALEEAAVMDSAVQGARASVLRRLASSGEPVVGADGVAHPAKVGILDRYGMSTVEDFEGILQRGLVTRKSWDGMREEITAASPFLQGKPAFWSERIVRTELMGAYNKAGWSAQTEANEELGDLVKILSATFDDRTAADSYAVHGQIRGNDEPFDTWFGQMQYPPSRPNDRECVVPHRISWSIPKYLHPRAPGEVAARWRMEGRKGSHPPIPERSTIPLDRFGR